MRFSRNSLPHMEIISTRSTNCNGEESLYAIKSQIHNFMQRCEYLGNAPNAGADAVSWSLKIMYCGRHIKILFVHCTIKYSK